VDRNRYKSICYNRAKEQGIATAKLPIGDYMQLETSQVQRRGGLVVVVAMVHDVALSAGCHHLGSVVVAKVGAAALWLQSARLAALQQQAQQPEHAAAPIQRAVRRGLAIDEACSLGSSQVHGMPRRSFAACMLTAGSPAAGVGCWLCSQTLRARQGCSSQCLASRPLASIHAVYEPPPSLPLCVATGAPPPRL
jgi:hypothetical protein